MEKLPSEGDTNMLVEDMPDSADVAYDLALAYVLKHKAKLQTIMATLGCKAGLISDGNKFCRARDEPGLVVQHKEAKEFKNEDDEVVHGCVAITTMQRRGNGTRVVPWYTISVDRREMEFNSYILTCVHELIHVLTHYYLESKEGVDIELEDCEHIAHVVCMVVGDMAHDYTDEEVDLAKELLQPIMDYVGSKRPVHSEWAYMHPMKLTIGKRGLHTTDLLVNLGMRSSSRGWITTVKRIVSKVRSRYDLDDGEGSSSDETDTGTVVL
jgi:hypothetical protein